MTEVLRLASLAQDEGVIAQEEGVLAQDEATTATCG